MGENNKISNSKTTSRFYYVLVCVFLVLFLVVILIVVNITRGNTANQAEAGESELRVGGDLGSLQATFEGMIVEVDMDEGVIKVELSECEWNNFEVRDINNNVVSDVIAPGDIVELNFDEERFIEWILERMVAGNRIVYRVFMDTPFEIDAIDIIGNLEDLMIIDDE